MSTQAEARAAGLHGWQICPCDTGVHIIPVGDLQDHMDEDCPCQPTVDSIGAIVHNSFDGREAFEEGERQPS